MINVKGNIIKNQTNVLFNRNDCTYDGYVGPNKIGIYRSRSITNPCKYAYLILSQNGPYGMKHLVGLSGDNILMPINTNSNRFWFEGKWEHCPNLKMNISFE